MGIRIPKTNPYSMGSKGASNNGVWLNRIGNHSLQLQTPSETVFGVVFWGLNTFSKGIWSTRDSKPHSKPW